MISKIKIKIIFLLISLVFLFFVFELYFLFFQNKQKEDISNFEECVENYGIIQESYPRRCITKDGLSFTEDIGNELQKNDLIIINNPRPNQIIESPLIVSGKARGFWFFEASFSIELLDEYGNIISNSIATAKSDWMTEDFVNFEADIIFEKPDVRKGKLILHKDNPSGLKENEDSLIIPIRFE